MKALAIGFLAASICVAPSSLAAAQASADAATCTSRLNAASEDSQLVELSIRVSAFDTSHHISVLHQSLIGEGIRQFVAMPRALTLDVYDLRPPKEAWTTMKGAYRAMLHGDGHITDASTVGGTRTRALDSAMVNAINALDVSGMLPPPDSPTMGRESSIEIRIVVATTAMFQTTSSSTPRGRSDGVTPLLRLRVPIRRVSTTISPKPGNKAPRYPEGLRMVNMEGSTIFEFVVDAAGVPEMATVQVVKATAMDFVKAAFDALPTYRFEPLQVEGCHVATIVRMPFEFSLIR